jgi:hypothetical protein
MFRVDAVAIALIAFLAVMLCWLAIELIAAALAALFDVLSGNDRR